MTFVTAGLDESRYQYCTPLFVCETVWTLRELPFLSLLDLQLVRAVETGVHVHAIDRLLGSQVADAERRHAEAVLLKFLNVPRLACSRAPEDRSALCKRSVHVLNFVIEGARLGLMGRSAGARVAHTCYDSQRQDQTNPYGP